MPLLCLLLAATAVGEDLWGPWRRPADIPRTPWTASGEARIVDLPGSIDVGDLPLTVTDGVEVSFRFRVRQTPPARLAASHTLAQLVLAGEPAQTIWLHAYSRNSGFMLNGLVTNKRPPWQRVLLARGAAVAQSAPPWDRQWHTVRLAWCRGRLAATWDGLEILDVVDPTIAYTGIAGKLLDPGPFGALEMPLLTVRPAHFAAAPE